MNIGKMDKRVKLLRPTLGEDTGFGATATWEEIEVWAEFTRPRFNSGALVGSGDATVITQGIRIRRRAVDKGWKVRYGNTEYQVLHVDESVPGETMLTTTEVLT